MALCRTCLSVNNLQSIFSDKNLISSWSTQLYLVTGVKIEPYDSLTQFICKPCYYTIKSALKLREQSIKSDEILRKTLQNQIKKETKHNLIKNEQTTEYYIKVDQKVKDVKKSITDLNIKNDNIQIKNVSDKKHKKEQIKKKRKYRMKKFDKNTSNYKFSVAIEDFESSNDEEIMNDTVMLEDIESDILEPAIRIEDYESSDSLHLGSDLDTIIEDDHMDTQYSLEMRERELVERERRKSISKEQERKLMSLAVTPYDRLGPIKCRLCDRTVRTVPNFKSHAKTHFELENTCEECGKKFVNRSHMRYHQQRVHGRTKRLACTQCTYRAVDLQALQNHQRAEHTGERPYVCDVCGDSFRMRANIAQHMRKHFGVRNLQCDRCPAMFRSRSELTGHQNKVHFMIYTYLCYLCPETYKRPASVKKHLANVHGVPRTQQLRIKCVKTRRRSCEKD